MNQEQLEDLLSTLFPRGFTISVDRGIIDGTGSSERGEIALMGTVGDLYIGVDEAHALAGLVIETMRSHPGRPILMLVNNSGQRLSRRDELLGNNVYLAQLAKSLEVARQRGHTTLSLVYGSAVSGGFLACGMSAEACFAMAESTIGVMSLEAMSRITQISVERLEHLNRTSPILGPGVDNFERLGVIEAIWAWDDDLPGYLMRALERNRPVDLRRQAGRERGGRETAADVAERTAAAAAGEGVA